MEGRTLRERKVESYNENALFEANAQERLIARIYGVSPGHTYISNGRFVYYLLPLLCMIAAAKPYFKSHPVVDSKAHVAQTVL